MKATATIYLDKRRKKKENTYPVKLKVTFDRTRKYYPTPYDLTEKEFNKILFAQRNSEEEKKKKLILLDFEKKATGIISVLPVFTFAAFEKQYLKNRAVKDSVEAAFSDYIEELKKEERIATAESYECARNSLILFAPKLTFADITPDFLRQYEKWMLDKNRSKTSVGIYLRSLRTILNNAIHEGLISKEHYPFGSRKYEIPTGRNIKKALSLNDISLIYHYQPEQGTTEEKARDYWLFMYFGNGMNVKDMSRLKWGDIKGNSIEYTRAKTERTRRETEKIIVIYSDELKSIVERWSIPASSLEDYVFPILTKGITAEREKKLIHQQTKTINKYMKRIAAKCGIDKEITTYFARHSFATVLKNSGVSMEFISEALGHSNFQTTKNYLDSFEYDKAKEAVKSLSAFK